MNEKQKCVKCGREFAKGLLNGICTACLMRAGLESEAGATIVANIGEPKDGKGSAIPVPGRSFGEYDIVSLLGKGGMGAVYEAIHHSTGRRLALKVLLEPLAGEDARKRFLREGRMAASISNKNSVYVYGTEVINEMPVITMELVDGGSLNHEVKTHGPMPVGKAVDAIMQVIEGLDAASKSGVMHRDVKPSNCFADSSGTIKVGDYGLSVASYRRDQSFITAPGSVLGTPAFCSPEQLQGDEIDSRADIYSVGATLYFLLTGEAPFESKSDNVINIVANVLNQKPLPLHQRSKDIPEGLSKVVARCLSKDKTKRFASYQQLRSAFLPYTSEAPVAANIPRRIAAGLIDSLIMGGLPAALLLVFVAFDSNSTGSSGQILASLSLYIVATILFFAIPEGLWGLSIGKWLMGLRLIGPHRTVPGIPRALARSLLFWCSYHLVFFSIPSEAIKQQMYWIDLFLYAAFFCTMRKSNGMAALHDLLTGVRVVNKPERAEQPCLQKAMEDETVNPSTQYCGPYAIFSELEKRDGQTLFLGLDQVLQRKVWIVESVLGNEFVSTERRDFNRPGRLRWLNCGTMPNGNSWNAFEACSGTPFLQLAKDAQSWSFVRFWLEDLSQELATALKDKITDIPVSFDRIWISGDNRAVILDFPCPGLAMHERYPICRIEDIKSMQDFLFKFSSIALQGSKQAMDEPIRLPLPLFITEFLERLRKQSFMHPDFLLGAVKPVVRKTAELPRTQRAMSLLLIPILVALLGFVFLNSAEITAGIMLKKAVAAEPKIELFRTILWARYNASEKKKDCEPFDIMLAHSFGDLLRQENKWNTPGVLPLLPKGTPKLVNEILEDYKSITPEQLKSAYTPEMEKALNAEANSGDIHLNLTQRENGIDMTYDNCGLQRASMGVKHLILVMMGAIFFILLDLLSILIFRTPILLLFFGIRVVRPDGEEAGRLRLLWRSTSLVLVVIAPWVAASLLKVGPIAGILFLCVIAAGIVIGICRPRRGLLEMMSGTYLVPRG